MRNICMILMMALVVSPLIPLAFSEGTIGAPEGVLRKSITSIKFLDAYFGTSSGKIEVGPGDKNVPFTISMANVGTQDLTGIKGQLLLPAQFASPDGRSALILADNSQKATTGNSFYLTFFVDVKEGAEITNYSGTVKVDYSRLRESGERQDFFDFSFKLTGDSTVNLTPLTPYITSITNNDVIIKIANGGSAPLSNVDVILKNDQTSVTATSKSKNLENVIFDKTHWDVGTIPPNSAESFSFKIFVPENIKNEPLHLPMEVTYYDAHGESKTVTRVTDLYINGLVDPYVYGVKVIDLSGKQTVIGDILNQGNSDGLFGFVTLKPRADSNIQESTQYIDEIEPDSPVPFNIPIGAASNGEHEITIEIKYKDSLRNDHIITYDTTIFVNAPLIANTGDGDSTIGIVVVIIILAIAAYIFYKRKRATIGKTS
uniref:S-layer domain-containing protein n=1 Tax=uncultured marine thaumarchaeote KM3_49_A08 TaxID=1456171 RepID=A0A075H4U4_9ARCH|nr:hypothetical protein [uncultured marine thaumarchaeote KM3_49_A08]